MSFFFGEFELDGSTYKLRRQGNEIPLQPKVFDAIRYLLENHDRVVLKEELLEALWPGEHVNDTAVPWTISRARKVLGQQADENQPIETVRGRGYRFTGDVRQIAVSVSAPDSATGLRLSIPPPSTATPVPLASPGSKSRPASDPFVGRTDAMERLLGALHEATSRHGRLCVLTGEAGIGKTRCISEFALLAKRLKVAIWTGRCLEGGRTAAFWPWVQVMRDALSEPALGPAAKQEIQRLLGEMSPVPETHHRVAEVAATTAVAARFWVLEKLSRIILGAELGPRVVLLDDVQWADEASLDLLIFLSAELSRAPVLVVATARDALLPGSEAWAKALSRLGPCERIELGRLRAADVDHYVAEVTGLSLPDEIQRTVYTKSGGNPLFLQETARQLTALRDRSGSGSLKADDITVPAVARDVLRARLTGLAQATCEVLDVACVLGQDFDFPVLQGAVGAKAEDLLVQLDEASRARLIAPRRRAGSYGFTHDTIREALYEELTTARRVELHARVARAFEERSGVELHLNDLAYHYYRALPRAEPSVAERYARMAGEAAMQGFAYEDAAQFFGWALDAQRYRGDGDPRGRCEVLLARAVALRLSGRVHEVHASVERAIEIARTHRFADLLSEAVRTLRPFSSVALVSDPMCLQALEVASSLVSDDQRSLRIRILSQLASIPPHSLSIEKSRELSAKAVALARESADPEDLVEALGGSLHALSGPDHIDELLEVADEMQHLDAYRNSLKRGAVEVARYQALLHKGDITAAIAAGEEIGRLGRSLRRPETLWHYERDLAQVLFHRGDFQEAQMKFQELAVKSRQLRLPYGKFFFIMQVLLLAYERSGVAPLQSSVNEWRGEFEWVSPLPSFRAHEARFMLEVGNVEEAKRAFEAMAEGGFQAITRELGYLNALAQLSLVAIALGDQARARVLYDLLAPYPNHNTPTNFGFYQGSVSYYLGLLASVLGRAADAVGHHEDALRMNAAMGFVPQLARTQLALAEALSEESPKAARSRAQELALEASATARRLEMAPLVAQVERFLSRTSSVPPSTRVRAR